MKSELLAPMAAADASAVRDVRALGAAGVSGVPGLLEALRTRSWVVRRHVVEQLAGLGGEAAAAMCQSLRTDRLGESRLAALVDALVASAANIDELVIALLDDPQNAVVCDALQIIGRRRIALALTQTIRLSAHEDDNIAVASIEALGQLGGDDALQCLLELVRSATFFRSFPAIDVLGRLGDTRAVETLVSALADPLRGPEAVRALGRLGDETALVSLLGWLGGSQLSATRVAAVAIFSIHERLLHRYGTAAVIERALGGHPQKEAIEVRLQRALSGADAAEKRAIGSLLGLFSSSTSVESLFALLGESSEVAVAAAKSLGRLARAGNTEVLELAESIGSDQRLLLVPELAGLGLAVPWLLGCLADLEPQVRLLACEALAKTGDTSAVPALFALLGEADLSLTQAATAALQSLGSAATEGLALAAAVATTGPTSKRHAALRILGYFAGKSALPTLLAAAADADERTRDIALQGLSLMNVEDATWGLLEASQHASARTRAAAVRGLGNVDATPATTRRLADATQDPDPWVRYQACQALGNAGDVAAAELLSARLLDSAGQVRVAAVDAIARLPGPTARAVLERAAQHEDLEVRRAALTGMGFAGQASSLPLLLAAAGDADTATRLVAISSLATYDSPQALARILEAARADTDASVQHAAIALLSELPTTQASVALVELLAVDAQRERAADGLKRHALLHVDQITAALEHASAPVADALIAALTRLPKAMAEQLLSKTLQSANVHARRAAVRALRVAFDAEAVRAALAAAATADADPEVRRVAAARLS